MNTSAVVETVIDWLRAEVCPKVKFKVPPKGRADDRNYEYETANPKALEGFAPPRTSKDSLADFERFAPAVFVRATDTDYRLDGTLRVDLELTPLTWSPGEHDKDRWEPSGRAGHLIEPKGQDQFVRDSKGWRDAWSLADLIVSTIRATAITTDRMTLRLDPDVNPHTKEDTVDGLLVDAWPFWSVRTTFTLMAKAPEPRHDPRVRDLV